MKKILPLIFFLILLLSACGNNYNVSVVKAPIYNRGNQAPVIMLISDKKNPATNLSVHASFEMESMNHGTYELDLTEKKKGTYEGTVALPMPGEYDALVTIHNGKEKKEKLVRIKVK